MYKLTFLERLALNARGDKYSKVFFSQVYDENSMPTMSRNWRHMGFIKLDGIEIVGKSPRLTVSQVIDLFYPHSDNSPLPADELEIKQELQAKYKPEAVESKEVLEENPERAALLAEAVELGVKVHHMQSDETIRKNIEKAKAGK